MIKGCSTKLSTTSGPDFYCVNDSVGSIKSDTILKEERGEKTADISLSYFYFPAMIGEYINL